MNAKITVKPIADGTKGIVNVTMKLFGDDDETELANDKIENVIINQPEIIAVTVDEIENRFVDVKSRLYKDGEGLHNHQIYKMAVKEIVAEKLGRRWMVS